VEVRLPSNFGSIGIAVELMIIDPSQSNVSISRAKVKPDLEWVAPERKHELDRIVLHRRHELILPLVELPIEYFLPHGSL
jgi:hypothetical protein